MISYVEEIAKGIDALLELGKLKKEHKVVLYGLDRYSFAMRTILSHRGMDVHAFMSEDEGEVLRIKRMVKDFACRYFRSERDAIDVWALQDMLKWRNDDTVILLATASYDEKKLLLVEAGFEEDRDFFKVYDFFSPEIDGAVVGKQCLTAEEIKQYGKDLLIQLDRFCLKNDLRYWVCGGTLLGTVRHKGFIPWDDDVDVFMPLKDYFRFLTTFPVGEYYALSGFGSEKCADFLFPFAKLFDLRTLMDEDVEIGRRMGGVWVDIFPLVGLPADEQERTVFFRQYREIEKSIIQEFYARDGDLSVFKDRFSEREQYLRKYDFDTAEYVGVLGSRYEDRDCTKRNVYDSTVRMRFEDIEVNVPSGYEEYLLSLYGDTWMTPPPASERKSIHKVRAYKA